MPSAVNPHLESELYAWFDRVRGLGTISDNLAAFLCIVFISWLESERDASAVQPAPRTWEDIRRRIGDSGGPTLEAAVRQRLLETGPRDRALDVFGEWWAFAADLLTRYEPGEFFDAIVDFFTRMEGRRGGESYSPASVRELMVLLADPRGGSVYDGAAGFGGLLADAARHATSLGGDVELYGQEINAEVALIARMRIAIHGFPGEIAVADTLTQDMFPDLRADYVLSVPPFGRLLSGSKSSVLTDQGRFPQDRRWFAALPSANEPFFAWAQHAIFHTAEGGRAILAATRSASFSPRSSTVRRRFLERGLVDAVIALPPGLFYSSGVPIQLWLFRDAQDRALDVSRRRRRADDRVLLIDGEQLGVATERGLVELTADDLERLVSVYRKWSDSQTIGKTSSDIARVLPVDELLVDSAAALDPARWLKQEPALTRAEARASTPIRRLVIENLKSVRDRSELELAPITLVYGPNSAGKTTVIQSLLLLKQTLLAEPGLGGDRTADLISQGSTVDLGSFSGLIHAHDEERVLRIGLEFEPPTPVDPLPAGLPRYIELAFGRSPGDRAVTQQEVVLGFGPDNIFGFVPSPLDASRPDGGRQRTLTLQNAPMSVLGLLSDPLIEERVRRPQVESRRAVADTTPQRWRRDFRSFETWLAERTSDPEPGHLEFTTEGMFPAAPALGRGGSAGVALSVGAYSPRDGREMAGPRRAQDRGALNVINTLAALLSAPGREVTRILSQLDHLGPLRAAPERFTELSRTTSGGIGNRGEFLVSHLYLHEHVRKDVNAWLDHLDIPYEVRVSAIGAGQDAQAIGDVVALILCDRRSGLEVSPKDVGFGISQLLPIVAHLLDARQSVTCVEQPEIHVHPRLQAELADLLIEATSEERGNQVIIETHSEHLMLRLQRRIRAGVLDPERVSVLYVDVDGKGVARVDRLRMDEEGNFIDPWPHGFFDERLDELFGGDE